MEARIVTDLQDSFGLACGRITPVSGGWLNQKWRVDTDRGEVLVKRFSRQRYSRDGIDAIEAALQRQIALYREGIPCPAIHVHQGRAIRRLDADTVYMVMAFCPGEQVTPDTVTCTQMTSLGDVSGRMRRAFAMLPVEGAKGYPLDGQDVIDTLWARYQANEPDAPAAYRAAVEALRPILEGLSPAWLDALPKGLAHEDFAPDNMLFDDEGVAAILDFDRSQYGFVWHDVGRVLLSLALRENGLDRERIAAFAAGYTRHYPLTRADIAMALRLTWCIEVPWWIQPAFFMPNKEKVTRFRDEILWLTKNWEALESLLDG